MADFELKSITSQFKKILKTADLSASVADEGTVIFTGDGILRADGLHYVKYFEVLLLENGTQAIALNLEENAVGAVVLDREEQVKEGMKVHTTGKLMEVPVGDAMLGRVVNALGKPIDGKGAIETTKTRPVESPAPPIIDRETVNVPLQTGLVAIDSMIPIGRGQRELIIGDRQTGKTAIALDTIINQKGKGVVCVYVAIGQKASGLKMVSQKLIEHDAADYTVIVSASANESAPLQYLAPYAGCAIAEEFVNNGKDVLIVYDDLSKHAVAYRTLSLLLKRPAGREAFLGDIFYLHSRLLERAGKLNDARGGGSMTALPIVETQAGDISAYIPTNVISITDGQIYLETELFNAGIRPAVNVGLSVSRVGGSAQIKAMRSVAGTLRLQLAQYRELAVFTQFGSDLDTATKNAIVQGEKLTEILKQQQFSPLAVEKQVILLYTISLLPLKNVHRSSIKKYFAEFLPYVESNCPEVLEEISVSNMISDNSKTILAEVCEEFTSRFVQEN